jgi:PKD repeat protein
VADHNLDIGNSANYYAVGFNETSGYIGPADVTWDNSNENVGVLSSAFGSQTTFTAFSDRVGTTTISARYESQEIASFMVTVLDSIDPEADAGLDLEIEQGDLVLFDGTDSSDNVEIEKYTWTFIYDGDLVTLESETPEFQFDIPGFYEITLEVTDTSGNTAEDTITIDVKATDSDDEPNIWLWIILLIIIIVVVLILLFILMGKRKKKQRCRICGKEFFPQSEAEAKEGMCPDCAKQGVFGQAVGSTGSSEGSAKTEAVTIRCPECAKEFDVQTPEGGVAKVICPHCGAAGRMEI